MIQRVSCAVVARYWQFSLCVGAVVLSSRTNGTI